ncbi:MAG: xanthine dehydrogenase family protein subunit M [Candidatus Glassbacteria bacterium]|nr:xanthine dehydrogenase family protein subunit M [Candidatus Glassbacteria bacterium]
MKAFSYYNAADVKDAVAVLGDSGSDSRALAGGTDLIGEIKNRYISPDRLVNLKSIKGLDRIKYSRSQGLTLGPLATLAEVAGHEQVRVRYPALAEAAESVGSPQLRNVGTIGGNICQRPRCWYYRGEEYPCLRKGGSHCYAVSGRNKYHCIIDGGPCFIVHPSDTAPALMALGARVAITSARGEREVGLDEFFVLPSSDPTRENILGPGEIVTRISVPPPGEGQRSCYLKFKERESRDFALVGAAVVLELQGRTCRRASVVLAGVAPVPHRSTAAEKILSGQAIALAVVEKAAEAAVAGAEPMEENGYKVQLTKTILKRAVLRAAGVEV